MSTLRSAVDELLSTDVAGLSDQELHDDLAELERASRAIEAARAERLMEAERRRSYAVDGYVSMAAWLRHRLRLPASLASQHVRIARALEHMPLAFEALAEGQIGTSAVGLLASARDADPREYRASEELLVELARTLPAAHLQRAVEHWRAVADARSVDAAAERRFARRALFVSPTLDGMVRVDGDLDPESGQTLITAIRAIVDAGTRSDSADPRTPAQRRADALGEICRRYLDSSDRPVVAGERPHVVVTVDLESLERRSGRRCELSDAGIITAEAARRLACDASVTRVVTRAPSEPLDVGRRTPVVPAPLRRALVVRDGGCRFPGCDRPPGWGDAHHVVHWADGGQTSLANLVLLCRRHHRAVHDRFTLELVDGRPLFRRRDGTPLDDRAPPR